jgi:Domain of unknown function (DUF4351)
MGRHDQLFKRLFELFLSDLLRLVAPGIARRLRVGEAELLPQEYFAGRPDGRRRELDLVARVPTAEGEPEAILVAVEAEARARASMGRRLWEYASLLGIHHALPVLPVVVFLRGGAPDITRQAYLQALFGEELAHFFFYAFGLSRSQAEQYLQRPEPLAWALAALMRRGSWTPSRHKLECLRRIASADLDDERRFLLVNCVETYLELEGEEAARFTAALAEEPNREVQAMEMTWSEKLEHKGLERGRAQGRQEGREQGRQEGMRSLLLGLMEKRLGPLPTDVRRQVEAIDSAEELSRLAGRVLDARSWEDIGVA